VPFRSAVEFLDSGIPETTCCLVLELRLPVMSGLTLQKELTKANIQVPLIFVTGHGCIATAVRAMKAGAVDFLSKPINEQHLLDAVFTALERDRLRRAQEEALSLLRKGFKSLTPRERQVLFRAAAGRLNKQIADELGLSEIMVKVHRSHTMRKMNAKSFAELVRMSDLVQSELLASGMHESAPRAAKLRKQFR
jgi:FixJ family two-component response regulator